MGETFLSHIKFMVEQLYNEKPTTTDMTDVSLLKHTAMKKWVACIDGFLYGCFNSSPRGENMIT